MSSVSSTFRDTGGFVSGRGGIGPPDEENCDPSEVFVTSLVSGFLTDGEEVWLSLWFRISLS